MALHTPAAFARILAAMLHRLTVAALVLALFAAPARAQIGAPPPEEGELRGEAWYNAELVSLSRVLGGVHYLRTLCHGRSEQQWRDYMLGVITREPAQRDALVAGFNSGFRANRAIYDDCTREAQQAEAELRAQGLRIADGLSARNEE